MSETPFNPRALLTQVLSRLFYSLTPGEELDERYGDMTPAQAADSILTVYAHELAERQRREAAMRPMRDGRPMAKMLTDLIDPKVRGG